MTDNARVVQDAFDAWTSGEAHISDLFSPDLEWEIVGRSAVSRSYGSATEFIEEVLKPFAARFGTDDPFRPTRIRGLYADDPQGTVIVIWDGRGTTKNGATYENTYAWIMALNEGLIVRGTAFYDSVAFNELWESVEPN